MYLFLEKFHIYVIHGYLVKDSMLGRRVSLCDRITEQSRLFGNVRFDASLRIMDCRSQAKSMRMLR